MSQMVRIILLITTKPKHYMHQEEIISNITDVSSDQLHFCFEALI